MLRGLLRRLRTFCADRSGNVAIIFALCMPVVAAGAAYSVETSYQYYKHQRLQAAADAAAYAGALELLNGSSYATIKSVATGAATANGWLTASGTIQVNNPPTSGPNMNNQAVEVILTQNEPRFFTALFSNTPVQLHRRAVAGFQTSGSACIVALDPTASQAISVSGNASMNLSGCDVASNSSASDGLYVWGSGVLNADCAMSAGGIANHGGLTLSGCPGGRTNAPVVSDPNSTLTAPSPPGGCINTSKYNGAALSQGYYCNGLDLKGNITLSPGIYYLTGGNLVINGNANVTGSDVTFYLTGGARVDMRGNSTVQITAPTSGTYSGILFFGDRTDTGTTANVFNGNNASTLTGELYFPSQAVTYSGNFSGNNGCTYIIADTVSWTGSTNFSVDCTASGMNKIPVISTAKLVE